jgi:AraC-like DNA-binding protein
MRVEQPTLIFVDRGIKRVRTERGAGVTAHAGQAIVLAGQQTVDFRNEVPQGTQYEARWLLFDAALLDDAYYAARCAQLATRTPAAVQGVAKIGCGLAEAFERAAHAITAGPEVPDAIVRQRVLEVMHWLLEQGSVLPRPLAGASVSSKIRALVSTRLETDWTAAAVARELALSEPTLRRRLAAEDTSFTELLVDARMATALVLLQATTRPVSDIACAVGYESPSRFAVRFRHRFGFAPSAVRGRGPLA